jgi:hypothetical protein
MGHPKRIEAWVTPLLCGSDNIATLCRTHVTRAVGQFIVPSLHPAAGQPQMLAGIVVDITQMVCQACRMLDCWTLLVGGSEE